MDEVELAGDEASTANRIAAIDAELDALKTQTAAVVRMGMEPDSLGFTWSRARRAEDSSDDERTRLTAERAGLVERLQRAVAKS